MTATQRADARVAAYATCIALVREAVAVRRAHAEACRMSPDERAARPETWRLPELDYADWYRRADAAVAALEATDAE